MFLGGVRSPNPHKQSTKVKSLEDLEKREKDHEKSYRKDRLHRPNL